jgi:hypothetical protein
MDLPNPKEIKALLKVCREFGVSDVEVGPLKVKFGDMPTESRQGAELAEVETMPDGSALPPGVTLEQMAYYSSAPDPLTERMAAG